MQACSQCLGRAMWLKHSVRSCKNGTQTSQALGAEAKARGSLAEMCQEPPPVPMLCIGINTPAFPVRGTSTGVQTRPTTEGGDLLDTEAFRSHFDRDTANTVPFKCASAAQQPVLATASNWCVRCIERAVRQKLAIGKRCEPVRCAVGAVYLTCLHLPHRKHARSIHAHGVDPQQQVLNCFRASTAMLEACRMVLHSCKVINKLASVASRAVERSVPKAWWPRDIGGDESDEGVG